MMMVQLKMLAVISPITTINNSSVHQHYQEMTAFNNKIHRELNYINDGQILSKELELTTYVNKCPK